MYKLITTLLTVVLLTVGCAPIRKNAIKLSETEVKNLAATQIVARNYLTIWPMQSGFLHGLMAHRQDEMPEHIVDAISQLDDLSEMMLADPNNMLDYDLGLTLGLRVRMIGAIVEEVVDIYAPDMLSVVPLLF